MNTVTLLAFVVVLASFCQIYGDAAVLRDVPLPGVVYEYVGGPRSAGHVTITRYGSRLADLPLEGEDPEPIYEYVGSPRSAGHTAITAYGKKMSPSNLRLLLL